MRLLEVKIYPEQVLRKVSQPIEDISEREVSLFEDMLFTMRHSSGIGLAAPQIGISRRLVVADIGAGALLLANPQIIQVKGKDKMEEGCLSVPGALVGVKRADQVVIRGLNEKGKKVELKAKGLLARVLQHEIDHLNGRLIVDYMNFLRKIRFKLSNRK